MPTFTTRPNLGDLVTPAPLRYAAAKLTEANHKHLDRKVAALVEGYAKEDVKVELAQTTVTTLGPRSLSVQLVFRIVDVGPTWSLPGAPN
jgi:hypothetical protein